ncbi:YjjG family noncanonical pyrimidine nucleotidase [Zhouia sp. PK063]|uniref:YjjG family noncanonical pyrimidine nucleotidase n=1 Tax=Zhouia sp. PK063 TaxID=3373602 RepID=UPI0037B68A0D
MINSNQQITDVFFDLDHTLWDFEKNSALTFEKILYDHQVPVKIDDFIAVYKPINFALWKDFREQKIEKEALRYERLKQTFNALDLAVEDEVINKLADDYIEFLSTYNHLFVNTIEVLEYLKPKYKLHIITNGFEEVQERKMRNANIFNYFKHVVNSEMVGVKKPDAKIFEYALYKAEVTASQSIMIGDDLEADIIGAQNVGMNTIHFNTHETPAHEYSIIISNLIEIKQYL